MSDKQYELPRPPAPEKTQLAQHPKERRRANIAIAIATLAALFTGWQAWTAHQARIEAKAASKSQAEDVERSRMAAEKSAEAAVALARAAEKNAGSAERSATASEQTARITAQQLETEFRPLLEITHAEFTSGSALELSVRNTGRTTAFNIRHRSSCEFGKYGIDAKRLVPQFTPKIKIDTGTAHQPDVPAGSTFTGFGNLPATALIRARGFPYDEAVTNIVRMTGEFSYTALPAQHKRYTLQWCYLAYISPTAKPGFTVCD